MYRALTSLWSKPSTSNSRCSSNKTRLASMNSSDSSFDEDTWVFVADTVSKIAPPMINYDKNNHNSIMTTSWIASPPLVSTDQPLSTNRSSSPTTHHFNPIENLLIEHASMSVYEQIASRTRARRHRKPNSNPKFDEQSSEIREDAHEDAEEVIDDDDDDDDRSSVVSRYPSQHSNLLSVHHRTSNASLNHSTNSLVCALESSTSSLVAHQRHLQRIHQRRRRSTKTTSKLALSNNIDDGKLSSNKLSEHQRSNYARTPKLVLHQPFRSNH